MLKALELRFAPTYHDDPSNALFKFQQHGSVNDYLSEFKHFANRIFGLTLSFLLCCFISGLTPDLHREVQALQPSLLTQAAAQAKLQETKLHGRHRSPYHSPQPRSQLSPTPTFPIPRPNTTLAPKIPFKRFTSEEMTHRRVRGLCYHCDDKWITGHRCKPRLHFLIPYEDFEPFVASSGVHSLQSANLEPLDPLPHISLHAMDGTATPNTFCLYGLLHQHRLVILVGGGSTHNFI